MCTNVKISKAIMININSFDVVFSANCDVTI